ncbi:MAG: VOC family protein [Fimbriimonadales bacterium]
MAVVRYLVTDLDACIPFYERQFGFKVNQKWGNAFAELEKDDLKLWLAGPDTSAAIPMPDGREPVAGGWNRIVIQVHDIEAIIDNLRDQGVVFRSDLIEGPGGKQALIEDPSGNPVEIFESR